LNPHVKIRGGVSEVTGTTVGSFTSRIHLMAIDCAAAEHGVLIKKKEKKERKFTSKT